MSNSPFCHRHHSGAWQATTSAPHTDVPEVAAADKMSTLDQRSGYPSVFGIHCPGSIGQSISATGAATGR
jgi:hypothetical protein